MKSSDTVRILQLAALSSVVDGQASEQEINTISSLVAEKCDKNEATIKDMAEKMITYYSKDKSPVSCVRLGRNAMSRLSGRNKKLAMDISKQVAKASDGVNEAEANFLKQLASFAK